jgi:hypothetical protein
MRNVSLGKRLVIEGQECVLYHEGQAYKICIHHPNAPSETLARNCQSEETAMETAEAVLSAKKDAAGQSNDPAPWTSRKN